MQQRIDWDSDAAQAVSSTLAPLALEAARAAVATAPVVPPSPAVFDLALLDGKNGFYIPGLKPGDFTGRSVAIAGDLDGDGYDDLVLGVDGADPHANDSAGEAYILFGAASRPKEVDISSVDGDNCFRIQGAAPNDHIGLAVASAGDMNGDGFDDVVVLSATHGGVGGGSAFVIFGKNHTYDSSLEPSSLDGHTGFAIVGGSNAPWAGVVAASADINHDGFSDLIIGAHLDIAGQSPGGSVYVVFGHAGAFDASTPVASLNGSNGFRIDGVGYGAALGVSVASAGDVNGDGIEDIAMVADVDQKAYVVFGHSGGFGASFDLGTLDGSNGFRISGDASSPIETITSIGDINGDGRPDLLIGEPQYPAPGTSSGAAYILFGKAGGYAADISLAGLDGTNGFRIDGLGTSDTLGTKVSPAGDFNGDGLADFIVSAPSADPGGRQNAGSTYVVFGRAGGYLPVLDLATLDGANGFRIDGLNAEDHSGSAIAGGGDINGDGFDDIIITAPNLYANFMVNAGGAYVIYGHATPANTDVIGTANDDVLVGHNGNDRINGQAGADSMYGRLGDDHYWVDSAGDLVFENSGEGTDTVTASVGHYLYANVENLVLAPGAGDIFGVGNELANVISGNEGANLLIAGAGDDTVHGGAGVDSLFGQDGADHLFGDAGVDYLVGGNGDDVLDGGTEADALYGEDGNDTLIGGNDFATDILVGGNGNDVLHGDSGLGDYDLMDGGAGDDAYYVDTPADLTFEAVGGGTDTVYANISGAGYYLYANVENLVLQGTTPYGVGNELDNHLTGNASANYLLGGAGNDVINGKGGNDVLFGESGADTFVFEHGTGGDVIGDFAPGTDKIDL